MALDLQSSRSKLLYWIASLICSGLIPDECARSGMLLPTLRIRSYARAQRPRFAMAIVTNSSPAASGLEYVWISFVRVCALQDIPVLPWNLFIWISLAATTHARICLDDSPSACRRVLRISPLGLRCADQLLSFAVVIGILKSMNRISRHVGQGNYYEEVVYWINRTFFEHHQMGISRNNCRRDRWGICIVLFETLNLEYGNRIVVPKLLLVPPYITFLKLLNG